MIPTIPELGPNNQYESCVYQAAASYQLPVELILAIMKVEGGRPGSMVKNKNNTYDHGIMQINTVNLNRFRGYLTKEQIVWDGCANIYAGSWLLKSEINLAGGDVWKGVGNYHSRTPYHHRKYQLMVWGAAKKVRPIAETIGRKYGFAGYS